MHIHSELKNIFTQKTLQFTWVVNTEQVIKRVKAAVIILLSLTNQAWGLHSEGIFYQ